MMSAAKRASLFANASEPKAAPMPEVAAADLRYPKAKTREGKRAATAYLEREAFRQLQRIALDEEKTIPCRGGQSVVRGSATVADRLRTGMIDDTTDPANESILGPAFIATLDYEHFALSVRSHLRYFRGDSAEAFLAKIKASCGARTTEIVQGSTYWRARRGNETELREVKSEEGLTYSYDQVLPFKVDGMKPIPHWQGEGRANPRGIPYLYLATTRDTAMSEVRPWIGSTVSVGRFEIRRDLRVIDCSRYHAMRSIFDLIGDKSRTAEDGLWVSLDQAFAKPVTRNDAAGEYIPTQIIAEMFRHAGFHGIMFKSLLSEDGINLVLFDLDDAELLDCELFTVESVSFKFQSAGASYIAARR